MSSLINNLNTIYETKLEIKEILHTESDIFADYPSYIQTAIQSGGAYGTIELTSNGTHDISTYASAYVNVPQEQVPYVPDGYTYVTGGKEITANGDNIDIASYSYVNVAVPIPDGFIYPSGYAYITTNGDFSIREFANVNVNVSGGVAPSGTYSITANGTFNIASYAYADVNVPIDWAYVAACGYTYTGGSSYTVVTWPDLVDVETSYYTGPADGTIVQMTDDAVSGDTVIGFNQITSEVISQLSNNGATDAANHLSSYIGSYLSFFIQNDSDPFSGGLMAIITNSYVAGSEITVTGPIYDLSPYQSGGLYMWLEIDATDVAANS